MILWSAPGIGHAGSDTTWVPAPVQARGSHSHIPVQLSLHEQR